MVGLARDVMQFELTPEQKQLKDGGRGRGDASPHVQGGMADRPGRTAPIVSAYAKAFGADHAMKITTDAVQIFGG